MAPSDLRIQLEGGLEVVEAEVAKWEAAARGLGRASWHEAVEWTKLTDTTEVEANAAQALSHKATRVGSREGLALLSRLEKARYRTTDLIARRLKLLGEGTTGSTGQQVARLREHLPVSYSVLGTDTSLRVGVLLAIAGVLAAAVLRTPWPLVLPMIGAAGLISRPPFRNKILVTRLVFVMGDFSTPLNEIEEVAFARDSSKSGWTLWTVDLLKVDGVHRQWLLGTGGDALSQALALQGVKVMELRPEDGPWLPPGERRQKGHP